MQVDTSQATIQWPKLTKASANVDHQPTPPPGPHDQPPVAPADSYTPPSYQQGLIHHPANQQSTANCGLLTQPAPEPGMNSHHHAHLYAPTSQQPHTPPTYPNQHPVSHINTPPQQPTSSCASLPNHWGQQSPAHHSNPGWHPAPTYVNAAMNDWSSHPPVPPFTTPNQHAEPRHSLPGHQPPFSPHTSYQQKEQPITHPLYQPHQIQPTSLDHAKSHQSYQ